MIYIFAAMYCEAHCIIEQFGLRKSSNQFFDVYESESIILTITGVGKVKAATAVSHIISTYGYKNCHILNVGCACGLNIGTTYVASTITDKASGKTYYPDLIVDFKLPETNVITVDEPCSESSSVYDMEASGIMQAVSCYLGPDRVTILKIISDDGSYNKLTSNDIKAVFKKNTSIIFDVVNTLCSFYQMDERSSETRLDKLSSELKCSEYMKGTLKQLISYAETRGIDVEQIISDYLPVTDRRRGKEVLDELRQRLIT